MIQEYTGKVPYLTDYQADPFRLLVAIACFVEQMAEPVHALVDTASEWCILPRLVADQLALDLLVGRSATSLSTRFGTLPGEMARVSVTFDATEGEPLSLQ